jgi:hypothetical protein
MENANDMMLALINALNPKIVEDFTFLYYKKYNKTIKNGLIFKGCSNWNYLFCEKDQFFYAIAKNGNSAQSTIFGSIEHTFNHYTNSPQDFNKF